MKNLVVIHLESLSWEIYNRYKEELTALNNIMSRSIIFENFFTSATSSIMAMSDFLYGNNFELDNYFSLDEVCGPQKYQKNLFTILKEADFRIKAIGYPVMWRDDINFFNIWDCKENPFKWHNHHDNFIREIDNFINQSTEKPFAIYIWDMRSHLYYEDTYKCKGKNSFERIKLGYKCLDDTIHRIIDILQKNNLMDSTIIAGFGDHGDECWTHSLNGGFCHGQEPYTNLIWLPAFIFDHDKKPEKNYSLASLIDLRQTCLSLLNLNDSNSFQFTGIDLFNKKNKFVYSQNLCSNQRENILLTKSYSITNEDYHLIVSNYGLEMYAYRFDPTNHNNLLNFFDLASKGNLFFNNRGAKHVHFYSFFSEKQIQEIKENFNLLCSELKERICIKNDFRKINKKFPFNIKNFNKTRKRHYIWNSTKSIKGIFDRIKNTLFTFNINDTKELKDKIPCEKLESLRLIKGYKILYTYDLINKLTKLNFNDEEIILVSKHTRNFNKIIEKIYRGLLYRLKLIITNTGD